MNKSLKEVSTYNKARIIEGPELDQLINSQIEVNNLYVRSITEMKMREGEIKSNKIFTEIDIKGKDSTINHVNGFVIKNCRGGKPLKNTLKDAIKILENNGNKYYYQIELIIHLIRLLDKAERENDIIFEYQMKELLKDGLLV